MMNEFKAHRFPAEWETAGAVMLSWPHKRTDWAPILDEVHRCYANIVKAISEFTPVVIIGPDLEEARALCSDCKQARIFFIDCPTNDTWIRDYGPLTVETADSVHILLDFRFNGWGLKFGADMDNLVNSRLKEKHFITCPLINRRDFVLEGGGIESDGNGTLMTTSHCQLSPNRNSPLSRREIENRLLEEFGARQILWLDHGFLAGDDTDSHIDTLARFAPDDTIVYTCTSNEDDEHFEELQSMKNQIMAFRTLDGKPFNLFELPLPDPIFDEAGDRLPATYSNYLVLPTAVIVPSYNQPLKDLLAAQIVEAAYSRKVVSVDCRSLIKQHGSLHCSTMQIPIQLLAL